MNGFAAYKPLRNAVSTLALDDSLRVIWAYCQFLQIRGFQFPSEIQIDRQFLALTPPQKWISEWNLEILAKEIILHSGNFAKRGRTLRAWPVLAGIVNRLKQFEDDVYQSPPKGVSALIILNRIAHQQFIWQANRPGSRECVRNYMIYNTSAINDLCLNRVGLSVSDLYLCGMASIGNYLGHPAMTYPTRIEIPGLTLDKVSKFFQFACRTSAELRPLFNAEQRYDDSFFYAYNPLRAYPLVRINVNSQEFIICPLPTLLFWRFTGGLYYDLVDDPAFGNAFGKSFQAYAGEAIRRACPSGKIRLLPEASYGSKQQRKDTVDWIAADGDAALFFECKAKRLSWGAKIAFDNLARLERDIDAMADAVLQLYKTIIDYEHGRYPHFAFVAERRIYPVVVTLEHWHLFGPLMLGILRRSISSKLEAAGIPAGIVATMPFAIWHIGELERGMQIVNERGIGEFMGGKFNDAEMGEWEWHPYMTQAFKGVSKNRSLFDKEYREMFGRTGVSMPGA